MKSLPATTIILALPLLALPLLALALKPLHYPTCAEGFHIIVARDTSESADPGLGALGALVQNITANVTGSDTAAVDYPATSTADRDEYARSLRTGIADLWAKLNASIVECPTSRIVLMGYGQGAQVVGDTLCGSSAFGDETAALNRTWGESGELS